MSNTETKKKRALPTQKQKVTALEESIVHWKELRDSSSPKKPDAEDCACCMLVTTEHPYIYGETAIHCHLGCPIYDYGEEEQYESCESTPFCDARTALYTSNRLSRDLDPWKRAAQVEIDFLEEVLAATRDTLN